MGYRKKIELNLLRDLISNQDGIFAYLVPSRYKVSIESLFKIIRKYDKYIEYKDGKIIVIEERKNDLIKTYFPSLRNKQKDNGNLIIPAVYIGTQIGIDDFYFPQIFRKDTDQEEPAF